MAAIAFASIVLLVFGLVVGFQLDHRLREWWRRVRLRRVG